MPILSANLCKSSSSNTFFISLSIKMYIISFGFGMVFFSIISSIFIMVLLMYNRLNPFCNKILSSSNTSLLAWLLNKASIIILSPALALFIAAITSGTSSFFTSLPLMGDIVLPVRAYSKRR